MRTTSWGWEIESYKEFDIALEPWGDGKYNAHLTHVARDNYDHGMVACYLPRETALADAKYIADALLSDPDAYAASEEDEETVVEVPNGND